jgi:hypothetical protein
MTRSPSGSSGQIRISFQPPADAQREKIPLFTDSELLSALLGLTHEVLGIRCDPGENFFDHGDSLAAAQLCALGVRRHGWMITPRDVFAWESFALLAQVIERDEAERRATAATPEQGGA